MATSITHALREAGAELPTLKQRIWSFLRDHPNSTCNAVSAALGVEKSIASSMLNHLTKANLVYVTVQPKKIFCKDGRAQIRQVHYYSARGESYHSRLPAEVKPAASIDLRKDPTAEVPEFDFRKFVKQLTPYQAREFYNALKEIFE